MTTPKDQMPDEIWAHEVDRCTVYMSGASPIRAYDRPVKHPLLGEPTKYLRADLVQAKDEEIAKLKQERELPAKSAIEDLEIVRRVLYHFYWGNYRFCLDAIDALSRIETAFHRRSRQGQNTQRMK